jgi:hypothetical protein
MLRTTIILATLSPLNGPRIKLPLRHYRIPLRTHDPKLLAPDYHWKSRKVQRKSETSDRCEAAMKTQASNPRSQRKHNNSSEDVPHKRNSNESVTEHLTVAVRQIRQARIPQSSQCKAEERNPDAWDDPVQALSTVSISCYKREGMCLRQRCYTHREKDQRVRQRRGTSRARAASRARRCRCCGGRSTELTSRSVGRPRLRRGGSRRMLGG